MNALKIRVLLVFIATSHVILVSCNQSRSSKLVSNQEKTNPVNVLALNLIFSKAKQSSSADYQDTESIIVLWSFLMYLRQMNLSEVGSPLDDLFRSSMIDETGSVKVRLILEERFSSISRIGESSKHGNTVMFNDMDEVIFVIPGESPVLVKTVGKDAKFRIKSAINDFIKFLEEHRTFPDK